MFALVAWVVLCAGGGALVGFLTGGGDRTWYQALGKPSWNPPGWLFGPVWTTLYVLMGVSAWMIWKRPDSWARRQALISFALQLAVNFAWSFVFFSFQAIGTALIHIIVLWLLIAATMRLFARVEPRAAWLLLPYLAWVSFATALNAAIVVRN